MINLDINIGDTILTGRFKNKKTIVKSIGVNDEGQPIINGKTILKLKIPKLIKKENKMTKKELETLIENKIQKILKEDNKYKIGDIIKFKDGEEWKIIKPSSFRRLKDDELHMIPHNKLAKEKNISMGIDISLDYIEKNKAK